MVLQHNFIDDITPNKETWRIKVRIIRTWKRPSYNNPNEDNSIDMVLIDERGKKIEATVKKSLIRYFASQIVEGELRMITNFDVGQNSGEYRTTDHPYKINFLFSTSVRVCEHVDIPLYGFNFVPFDNILSSRQDDKFLIDVIGEVVGVGSLLTSNKDGKQVTRLDVELEDLEKKKLKCTLWGKFAEQMTGYVADRNGSPIILIMQFAKIKSWNGGISLSNALFSTRLFINNEMDAIMEFKQRLGNNGEDSSQRLSQLSTQTANSALDEFLHSERKFVTEIREIRKKCYCVTLATIACIQTEYNWFYPSCNKCKKKVKKDDDGEKYFCNECHGYAKFVVPRYKVQVRVVDDTGSASFVMFDKHVIPVLQKSAYNLRESLAKAGDIDAFPEELNAFVGKKYLFVVEISDYNLLQNWTIYTVVRMSDDEEIINNFLSSSTANQDKEGDGYTPNNTDSIKPLNDSEKDSASFTGENEYQSDFSLSSPLGKRSFETTSVDDEDVNAQSSTNNKKFVVKIENDKK